MTLFLTLDDNGGMLFNRRRQSRDAKVAEDMLVTASGKIAVSPYTAPLFPCEGIEVTENPAGTDGFCFIENTALPEDPQTVIVYRWNRVYPADRKSTLDLSRYRAVETTEFAGKSHEKITKTVYERIR